MALWQMEAATKMSSFMAGSSLKVERIAFAGSMLDYGLLDVYSDIDMEIYLSNNAPVDFAGLLEALEDKFCAVFGYQIFNYDDRDTLRLCLENGWRFDLTFIYSGQTAPRDADDSFLANAQKTMNEFWYTAVLALVKFGRGDYLVASHLALELCRLNIAVQMLLRDNEKKTSKHRFGDKEEVPVVLSLLQLRKSGIEKGILNIIYQAAENMDSISESLFKKPTRIYILREIERQLNPSKKR